MNSKCESHYPAEAEPAGQRKATASPLQSHHPINHMKTHPYLLPQSLVLLVTVAGMSLSGAEGLRARNGASPVAETVGYPGPAIGRASIQFDGQTITAGNAALSLSWKLTPKGLAAQSVRDEQRKHSHLPTGEVFQIVLTDGQRYAASALMPEGRPHVSELVPNSIAPRLAARIPGRQVELPLHSTDGRLRVIWRALLHDGANYARQEIDVVATVGDCAIREIVWFDEALPGARTLGQVDGSPIVADGFFFGCEDPMARNLVTPPPSPDRSGHVSCRMPRNAILRQGEPLTLSFVWGVAPAGQLRRGFLHYLERERAHPYRPYLHYNSWYDTAWQEKLFEESDCLDAVRTIGRQLIQPHGVVVDGMVFDDGWDDPRTLWQFNRGFPDGFTPLAELCRQYQTRLGVWLSPFGGYGERKQQRLRFGREHGYEVNATGFSLAGPKYYAVFKQACVEMIRRFGVNHFKFDGIAAGKYASSGGAYLLDTEALRRLMLELRQEDPNLLINFTVGSWPSPFWLRFTDTLWRQGPDMGLAGKGSNQQQWLTYRDREVYRNVVEKAPLFPLSSLMTLGVAYSRAGPAGDPTFNSAGFKDDVRAFFGAGTSLQELYIQPGKLTTVDWNVLAEAAKWSRANADALCDTHWLGGDPSKLEVYGYASWSPRKGVIMLRNPNDRPQEFALDVGAALELPPGAPTTYRLKSPWQEDSSQPAITGEAGKRLRIVLKPFETVVFDAVPAP